MWDNLSRVKEPRGALGIVSTCRKFYRHTLGEGGEMVAHIAGLHQIQHDIHSMGEKIEDTEFVVILITLLPSLGTVSLKPSSALRAALGHKTLTRRYRVLNSWHYSSTRTSAAKTKVATMPQCSRGTGKGSRVCQTSPRRTYNASVVRSGDTTKPTAGGKEGQGLKRNNKPSNQRDRAGGSAQRTSGQGHHLFHA